MTPHDPHKPVPRHRFLRATRHLARHRTGLLGMITLGLLVAIAVGAPVLTTGKPTQISLGSRLMPPLSTSGQGLHLLGTDGLGRDILTRMAYGARISLSIASSAVLISILTGVGIGLVAGYSRGWLDNVLMRLVEAQLAFPFILLALTVLAALGPGLPQMILVLGVGRWVVFARVVRAQTLSLMQLPYIEATRALGASATRTMLRHLLPNTINVIIIVASFTVATNILTEAALSFLGLGLDIRIPTWGAMLAEGREYLPGAWWLATFPGLAILVTVLAINSVGDWLRDFLDPNLQDV